MAITSYNTEESDRLWADWLTPEDRSRADVTPSWRAKTRSKSAGDSPDAHSRLPLALPYGAIFPFSDYKTRASEARDSSSLTECREIKDLAQDRINDIFARLLRPEKPLPGVKVTLTATEEAIKNRILATFGVENGARPFSDAELVDALPYYGVGRDAIGHELHAKDAVVISEVVKAYLGVEAQFSPAISHQLEWFASHGIDGVFYRDRIEARCIDIVADRYNPLTRKRGVGLEQEMRAISFLCTNSAGEQEVVVACTTADRKFPNYTEILRNAGISGLTPIETDRMDHRAAQILGTARGAVTPLIALLSNTEIPTHIIIGKECKNIRYGTNSLGFTAGFSCNQSQLLDCLKKDAKAYGKTVTETTTTLGVAPEVKRAVGL